METGLTILSIGRHMRLGDILEYALDGRGYTAVTIDRIGEADLTNRRILFAITLEESGLSLDFIRLLEYLRLHPASLLGSTGAVLIDSATELYTKELARALVFDANMAGCRFPGRALVEATKSLKNFGVLSGVHGIDRYTAYKQAGRALLERLLADAPVRRTRPKLLVLHASNKADSNTLALGGEVTGRLRDCCDLTELSLRAGAIYDCNGCSYKACRYYAEQETCFYGGTLPEAIFPAIGQCDALLLCCPNYNDAPGAHFLALNNRLNALLLRGDSWPVSSKALFSVIVSGYSGGDIVAKQLLGGFCLNKPFCLPPHFAMMETANDPGTVLYEPGIAARIDAFAGQIRQALVADC